MVEKKSDFVFVSENALKNISVTGAQYPVRGGKLALLGEDAAVLEEAIRERSLYLDGTVFNNEFLLPIGHPIPSGSAHAGSDAVQSRAQYDQRIREIRGDVDEEYTRIKRLLASGNWIDKNKAAEIEATENPIIKCTGDVLSGSDYVAAVESFNRIVEKFDSDFSELRTAHNQALSDLQSDYEAAVAAENTRFEESSGIQEAIDACADAVQRAEDKHADATNAEETVNEGNVAEINRRLDDGEITKDKADDLLAREAERHGLEVEKTDNRRVKDIASAELDRDRAIIRATEAHFDTLKDLEDAYDEDVAVENEEYERSHAELLDKRDDEITALSSSIPDLMDYILNGTTGEAFSKAWRKRDEAFKNAVIRKSCADAFYSRNPLFKPSSTAINRIYADLERMDDVFDKGVSLWREKRIYTYGDLKPVPQYPSSYLADNYLLIVDEDYVGTYDNYDFFFFYGHRHEIDRIHKIYADAILYRHDHLKAGAQTGEESEEDQSTNEMLAEASDDTDEKPDRCNKAYSIARVEFTLEKIPNAEEYAVLDAISDRLEAGRKELIETRDESLKESRLAYQQDLAHAQHDYDEAVASAARTRDDAKTQANIEYVHTLWGIAPSINARLSAAKTDEEKALIWEEFERAQSSAVDTMRGAEASADSDYNSAVDAAMTAKRAAQETAISERFARDDEANSAYSDANTELKQRLSVEAQAVYDAHAAKKTAADQKRTQELQTAAQKRDGKIGEIVSSAVEEMTLLHDLAQDEATLDDGWTLRTDSFGITYIAIGPNAMGDIVLNANRINSSIRPAQSAAWSEYNEAVEAADRTRWESISDLPDIQPSARGKFKASLRPVDSCGINGKGVTQRVQLVGIKNLEIVYRPWTATGGDFSEYYSELEDEDAGEGPGEDAGEDDGAGSGSA